ncbi:TrlF family AAA-like ATPase [Cobetia sp. Ld8]|uniref:TrlF family AAA-like ATPase n=1 Tax=Cobetia sp. Ld8 TaxID=649154 RepID=UPI00386DAF9F
MKHIYSGSRWYKFDFHTHTPASSDYKIKNETPEQWLKALMLEEIDCVAITDHVTGYWVDILKKCYESMDTTSDWYRPIELFPGCEITISTGQSRVHLLAIFGYDCNTAKINAILGQCGITGGHGDADSTCATESIEKVIDIISKAGGIAIPAHIDGAKGFLHKVKNLNQEITNWLKKIEAAEFINLNYLDQVNPELATACSNLAKLQGSDAHECSRLGKRFTWIKMSTPSIEGLSLALYDHNLCVINESEDPNSTPDIYIKSLSISQMQHCGRINSHPTEFNLHPLFNAVIGGRGSGKSTFIESIRLAMGREDEASELTQIHTDIIAFKNGVTNPNTVIKVGIQRRDELYQSIWKKNSPPYIEKYRNDDWVLDNGKPKERFNVSLYSQKQINSLASNPNSLLDIIDRSDEVNISEWNVAFSNETANFLTFKNEVRLLEGKLNNRGFLASQKDDLNSDIESFEKGGHRDIFHSYQRFVQEKQKLDASIDTKNLVKFIDNILTERFINTDFLSDETTSSSQLAELEDIQRKFNGRIIKFKEELTKLKAVVIDAEEEREKSIQHTEWYINGCNSEIKYNEIVSEYQAKGVELNPDKYETWIRQRNIIDEQIKNLDSVEKTLLIKEKECEKSLIKLYKLRRRLQQKRQKFISKVIGGNKYVRMKLEPFSSHSNIESQFRSLIGIENSFSSSIYQDDQPSSLLYPLLTEKLAPNSVVRLVAELKSTIVKIAKQDDHSYPIHQKLQNSLVQKLVKQPESYDRLMTWWPEDNLVVEYAKDIAKEKFENIEKGSAGQKAAAILAFLLSHGDNPIIVDQPEDDLDNALIYQLIVSQIHENKKKRQIIMVTHNPNIVVNGDAELVNVLEFKKGQIQITKAGGLCEKEIREHVCNIMEGGTTAFDKRYQRLRSYNS